MYYKIRWSLFVVCIGIFNVGHSDVGILTDAAQTDYALRSRASYIYDVRLGDEEVAGLLRFITRVPSRDVAKIDELASLKNNAVDILLKQQEVSLDLLPTLRLVLSDTTQGEIWCEYVVQKLPELALRLGGPEQAAALGLLRERIADTDYIYAGTALLGLRRLRDDPSGLVTAAEVTEAARKLLNGNAYANPSKQTALQVLADGDAEEARLIARRWLTDQDAIMLKVSALATLGRVGEESDRASLERYAQSPELRLRTAARAALSKLGGH